MNALRKKFFRYVIYGIIGGCIVFGLLKIMLVGYSVSWTGFADYTKPNGEFVRGKTLWDWMQLFIIPIFLSVGVFFLNRAERDNEREIATDRQQEAALQAYFDRMSELLFKEKLRTTEVEEVRDVARTRTLSIMRVLDAKRNNLVLQFLREARLITDEKSILNGANMAGMDLQGLGFREVYLQGARLVDANLRDADLRRANLQGANLIGAYLKGAWLDEASLDGAELQFAKLQYAYFRGAKLQGANLQGANLKRAHLPEANLQDADLSHAYLASTSLEGANLKRANLVGARGWGAVLWNADLEGAKLQGAHLQAAHFKGAKLQGANLQGAKLLRGQLELAGSLQGATMPDGTKHE